MHALRRKIYSSCLIAVSIIIVTRVIYHISSSYLNDSYDDHGISGSANGAEYYEVIESKKLKKNIFFLKTHRTSGTTIMAILLRFGIRHMLDIALPKSHTSGFYETFAGPLKKQYLNDKPIPPGTRHNILAHHTRYRQDTFEFLYPDVTRVTILRDPAEQFESNFMYFDYSKKVDASWRQFLDTLPINNTAKYLPGLTSRIKRVHFMSYDLGLDYSNFQNHEEILKFIRRIDDEFDLVMIREHFEASLVLLANLMGWPLHYVSFISLNVRPTRNNLNKIDRLKLSQLNYADHLLYQHFMRKFQKHIDQYGLEKMKLDIQKLLLINYEFQRRCFMEAENAQIYAHSKETLKLKDTYDLDCFLSSRDESSLRKYMCKWQSSRLKPIKKLYDFMMVKFGDDEI